MGNEVSKESSVEPPAEWDPASNAKKFELVSPMSDLSDPSMFLHRRPHPKLSDATVQQIAGKKQTKAGLEPPAKLHGVPERRGPGRQTTATDRRRRSKVIATRDSAYKHESRPREMPPPSAFYFPNVPTRESEETINRLSSSTGARRQSNTTMNKSDNKKNDLKQENKEVVARKNTPMFRKARRKVNRAKTCLTGCFEESGNNLQLMKDNAHSNGKRGQRLSSEAGTKARESLETVKENQVPEAPAFDPYQEDPLPKAKPVLQFINGTEQALTFNPVWRESHDGTYHSDPSSTGDARRSSDFALEKRASKESSRRASDPPSRDFRPKPAKKESKKEEKKSNNEQVPHPPGDLFDRSKEEEKRESFESKKMAETRESVESSQASQEQNRRESSSSAPSHESSYWNGFYKEAQVLHHEDAYFDRIAFDPNKSSAPEPSPMANNSTATPVAALFGGQEKPKSLLGSLDAGDVDDEEAFGPAETADNNLDHRVRETASRIQKDAPSTRASLKSAPSIESFGIEHEKASQFNQKNNTQPPGVKFGQPMTETGLDEKVLADDHEEMADEKTHIAKKDSFLDRRITADQILAQTFLVTKMPERKQSLNPSRLAIKEALQTTPQSSAIVNRTSFGSAFSYRDKDVFTPVTSSTTYPNGSPFRPRLAIAEKTMAKADLDKPVVFTQSYDDNRSRSSRDMEIHASESAPSMIESHDYRDIALGCFPDDEPSLASSKQERALALYSPSIMDIESPMSNTKSPGLPLLSSQVVDNAAFLFSPSYANDQALVSVPSQDGITVASQRSRQAGQIELKARERTYSISTLGSRSRLSGRSHKSIRIPCSSSASAKLIQSKEKNRLSEGSRQQKSVRFSDGGESIAASEAESQKSQRSRRSVTWDFSFKEAPENVDIPAIESKISDLSDTVFGDSLAHTKRESTGSYSDSVKSALPDDAIEEETTSITVSESVSQASLVSSVQLQTTSTESDASNDRESLLSITSHPSSRSSISTAKTPEQATRTWTYNEFTKGVTPLLDRKQLAQATNSPVLRFKAAKNKFLVKPEKEVPFKKSCPTTYKRKAGTGRVHLLASQFDNGRAPDPMALKSTEQARSTAGSSSLVPGERRMLRTPQIIGYTAKTHPDIYSRASVGSHSTTHTMTSKRLSSSTFGIAPQRTMSVDESLASKPISETPFDEIPEEVSDDDDSQHSGSDDSTLVQSVATLRQDRNSTTNVIESYQEQDALDAVLDAVLNQSDSRDHQDLPEDEIADDFAELLLNNILNASESSASTTSNIHQTKQGGQNILYAYDDEENSTFTNIQAAPTFSDESTTMSAMLAQQTPANLRHGAQTVKPHVQKLHGQAVPTTQALNLSPLQMTPARSLKWRELAEQAQKQDNQKKNSIFRGKSAKNKKKSGLSERNTNII